jgi:hypothetical protein
VRLSHIEHPGRGKVGTVRWRLVRAMTLLTVKLSAAYWPVVRCWGLQRVHARHRGEVATGMQGEKSALGARSGMDTEGSVHTSLQ